MLLAVAPAAAAAGDCVVLCEPTTTTTTAPPAPTSTTMTPAPDPGAAAATLAGLLNRARADAGLAPVVVRADIAEIAQAWSQTMASAGSLSHNDGYFTDGVRSRIGAGMLGENVAVAGSVEQAHRALMDSPRHRDNILDARFTAVGVGAELRDGRWWFTQDFAQVSAPRAASVAAAPPTAPTPRVRAAAAPTGPVTTVVDTPASTVDAAAPVRNLVELPSAADGSSTEVVTEGGSPPSSAAGVAAVGVVAWVGISAAVARRLRGCAGGAARGARRAGGGRRR